MANKKKSKAPAMMSQIIKRKMPSAEDILGSSEEVATHDQDGKPLKGRLRLLRMTFAWSEPVMGHATATIQAIKPDPGRPFTNQEKVKILHEALTAPTDQGGLGWTLC